MGIGANAPGRPGLKRRVSWKDKGAVAAPLAEEAEPAGYRSPQPSLGPSHPLPAPGALARPSSSSTPPPRPLQRQSTFGSAKNLLSGLGSSLKSLALQPFQRRVDPIAARFADEQHSPMQPSSGHHPDGIHASLGGADVQMMRELLRHKQEANDRAIANHMPTGPKTQKALAWDA